MKTIAIERKIALAITRITKSSLRFALRRNVANGHFFLRTPVAPFGDDKDKDVFGMGWLILPLLRHRLRIMDDEMRREQTFGL